MFVWLILLLCMVSGLVLIFALIWLVIASLKGAPFVAMDPVLVKRIVELSRIEDGDRAIDLGSGDGRLVLAMAAEGAMAEGYELQPLLVWWSRLVGWWWQRQGRLKGSVRFYQWNLWMADCRGAKVVTLYAFPNMMLRLEQKLQKELPKGSKVISVAFTFPNWEPVLREGKILVYEKE